MEWTDNPERDAERDYVARERAYEARRPKCVDCGELLYGHVYQIDGEVYCKKCADYAFGVEVHDLIVGVI